MFSSNCFTSAWSMGPLGLAFQPANAPKNFQGILFFFSIAMWLFSVCNCRCLSGFIPSRQAQINMYGNS